MWSIWSLLVAVVVFMAVGEQVACLLGFLVQLLVLKSGLLLAVAAQITLMVVILF
jgi:hypothetical protein